MCCVLTDISPSCPGQSSTALQVSCPFSYCIIASHRLISLLQRYIILIFLPVLPMSNTSLPLHSTIKPVFLPGHQMSKQIIENKSERRPCSQVPFLGFICDLDNTELNLLKQCSNNEVFLHKGMMQA